MSGKRHEVRASRVFAAPRDLVWAVVADTNRWDRAAGLAPADYGFREIEGARQRVASSTDTGFAIEWIEPPYRWIEGRSVRGYRRFITGPVGGGGFEVTLSDVEGGTMVDALAYTESRGAMFAWSNWIMTARFKRALKRFLDSVGATLKGSDAGDRTEPAVVRAQRLLSQRSDMIAVGHATPADVTLLQRRCARLGELGVPDDIRDRFVKLLRERPDDEVTQIRPFELARVWSCDRRELLRSFLIATRSGLFDLRWQINCPVCRVSAAVRNGLENVAGDVHCGACNIDYHVDFDKHVEAVFSPNAAIRPVTPALYCASSPSFRPHVFAQLRVPAGGRIEERADLFDGDAHFRVLGGIPTANAVLHGDPARVDVVYDGEKLEATTGEANESMIAFENKSDREATLLIERSGWAADMVLGSIVVTFPDFTDLFATEAPASGVELSIGQIALLFSDLTGSTALYERVGDAKAFAVVERHFQLMERAVRDREGTIVKTMGDAVMASFPRAENAMRAALEMIERHREAEIGDGVGLKLGVHMGPCLAVRANERMDFFGTTVNLAARLQGMAKAGELVITAELASDPSVDAIVGDFPKRSFEANLKGIEARQKLVAISIAAEPAAERASA
jgi:adenylate cyclase